MKKLMMAVAIVCAAAAVQASTIKWSSSGIGTAGTIYAQDGSTKISALTGTTISSVYLFNVATLAQADLLTGLRAGTYTFGDSALDSTSVASSKIAFKTTDELTALADTTVSVYYAILTKNTTTGDEAVLIASIVDATIPVVAGDSVAVSWGSTSQVFSKVNNGSANYSAAGWYAIPEPTSGLLLLVGGALLALRRRRA